MTDESIKRDVEAARHASSEADEGAKRTAAVITNANSVLALLRARDDHFTERVRATIIGGKRAS